MSYQVRLSPVAEGDLSRMNGMLAHHVLDQLEQLAGNPVGLSRPPSFPHPLYQKYQFFWPPDAQPEAHVTVLFQYSQDETALEIVAIGVVYMDS